VTVINAGLKALLQGSLQQIWSFINALQLLVHIPLFKVKFPEEVIGFISEMTGITTFDIPYINI